ncbi:uncharacterized protein SCHCODRAFT_02639642 [Schizophyllum commune H4-8]|uniref:Expressed protein n=1 Tax=Schizophyllum commune (strain H4-8 / FGSC 9210) TaxID=578458 RepID=D8QGH5_SCHCM|nr:uncharacterized protein SCHCODRAFT_02639642 [Schizophyllum commune H4-8]KAI5888067.1 hypothetical protein SCHCODRAFT_02639642 [Schizophyllum commune H4-8]
MNNLVFGPSGAISFVDGQDTGSPSTKNDDQLPQQAPFAIAHNAEQPAIASDSPLSALFTPDAEASTQSSQASPTASDSRTAEATPPLSTGSSSSISDAPSSSSPVSPSDSTTSATSITQVGSIASSSSIASSMTSSSLSSTSSTASSSSTSFSSSSTAAHISATPSAVLSSTQGQHGPPFYIGLGLLGIAAVAIVAALIAWLVRMRSVSRRQRYAASLNIPWVDDDTHSFSNDKTNGYAFNHATSTFIHSSEKASPPELAHLPSAMDSRDHLGARQLQITNMNPGDNHSVPSSGVPSPHPNEDMGTPRAQFAPRYLAVGDGGLDVPWAAPQLRPTLSARLRGRWKAQEHGGHPDSAPFDHQTAYDRQPEQPPTIPPPDTTGWTSTLRQSVVNAFTYALPATLVAGPPPDNSAADNLTAGGPPSRASTRRASTRRRACDLERGPSEGYVGGELVGLPYGEPYANARDEPALSRRSTASTYIPTLDAYMGFDHAFSPNPMGKRFEGRREGALGDGSAQGLDSGGENPFEAPRLPRKSSTELTMPEGMMAMGSSGMGSQLGMGSQGMGSLQMPRPAAVADTRVAPVSRMGSVAVPSRRESLAAPSRRDTLAAPSRRDTLYIPSRVSSTASRMSKLSGPEEFARQRLVERAQRRRVSGCVEVEEEGLQ